MTHKITEEQIRRKVFASYLKQAKGENLTSNDKANIRAWELMAREQNK